MEFSDAVLPALGGELGIVVRVTSGVATVFEVWADGLDVLSLSGGETVEVFCAASGVLLVAVSWVVASGKLAEATVVVFELTTGAVL